MKYKKYIGLVLVLIGIMVFWYFTQTEDGKNSLQSDYIQAVSLIKEGDVKEAKTLLEACIKKDPEDGRYNFMLANAYRNEKNFKEALENYYLTIEKSPEIKEGYNNIAAILMVEKDYEKAKEIINTGLNDFPDYSELIFKKAQLKYFDESYKETINLMKKIVDDKNYIEGYRFIGLSYLKIENKEKASENFNIYLEKSNNSKGKSQVEEIMKQW